MELQWIIQTLLGIIVTGLGWFMRETYKFAKENDLRAREAEKEIDQRAREADQRSRESEVHNLKTFAIKEDIKDELKQVHEILNNIYNKLDSTINKPKR